MQSALPFCSVYNRLMDIEFDKHLECAKIDASLYACFCVRGKWPQMVVQIRFLFGRLTGRQP